MKTLHEFMQHIQHKDIEGNHTYLWAEVDGRRYGQSYPNTVNTLQGMIDNFAVCYYQLYQDDYEQE